MSGITEIRPYAMGPEEEKIIVKTRAAFKKVVQAYFISNKVKESERAELSDYIMGFEENKTAGFFGRPYILGIGFDLKDPKCGLADYREWILGFSAALGPKHDLSIEISEKVLSYIFDSMPTILAEQSVIYTEAMGQLSVASALAKQTKSREEAMVRQLDTLRRKNQDQIESLQGEIQRLNLTIEEKDRTKSLLERVAETQADSVKKLLSMGCLEQAIGITIQTFRVLEASLDELKQIDVAVQATRLRKDEIKSHLSSAQSSLSSLQSTDWLSQRSGEALSTVTGVGARVAAFTARSAQAQSVTITKSQAELVKLTLKRVVKKLEKYESTIKAQWFHTWRKGYKKKKPVVDAVISSLKEMARNLNQDGSNAYVTLQEANARILGAKYKSDGSERGLYRKGNNYSKFINKALNEIDLVMGKSVVEYQQVRPVAPGSERILAGISSEQDLVGSIERDYHQAVLGLNVTLRDETTAAVNSLEAAEQRFDSLDRAITGAASVRENFITAMERAFDQRVDSRETSETERAEMLQDTMREVSTIGSRIHARLRRPEERPQLPFAQSQIEDIPIAPAASGIIVFGGSHE